MRFLLCCGPRFGHTGDWAIGKPLKNQVFREFQWWLGGEGGSLPDDLFQAQGFDGQYIYVIPSLDLVVVRNGT